MSVGNRTNEIGRAVAICVLALAVVGSAQAAEEGSISSAPLAPRSHPRGKTLFTRLSPETTGVRTVNAYNDPRIWGQYFHEFSTGSIGTGVAIGDYDGDGRPDLYVVSKMEGCRLFRNRGDDTFEDVTDKAGVGATPGVWNQGATFVDINNHGLLDIYVCRFNAPNLLYINQGDGTFKEMAHAYGLDVVDSSVMASFCDYDRDGWLDVYIATNVLDAANHPHGQRGYLFHNNRNGTFTNVTDSAGIAGPSQSHSATWWDYDNDGWPDLYVANDFGAPDRLYHNNRDGTFTDRLNQVLPHTSYSSMGSDLADLTNDGYPGLMVADMSFPSHQRDQRGPADERARIVDVPDESSAAPKYPRNALYLGTGTGHVREASELAGLSSTEWTWSVRFEDLDNDGLLDLFVTNGMDRDSFEVNPRLDSAESPAERIRIMRDSPAMAETHLAFRNRGDLRFESVGPDWGLNQKGVSFGTAFGDLGGDGNLDIVYTNYQGGVTVLRNDEDAGHRATVYLRGTASNRFGIGATVTVESALGVQTRPLWLARGYLSSSEPMVHVGLGNDTLIRRLTVAWPSGRLQTFENLPADRRYTITEPSGPAASPASPTPSQFAEVAHEKGLDLVAREETVDESYEQRLVPFRFNRRGPSLAVGDLDGGGRESIVFGGTTVDPLRILRPAGDRFSVVEGPSTAAPSTDDGPVLLVDTMGNGRLDLLETRGGNTLPEGAPEFQPRLYLNDGKGAFQPAPEGTLPSLPINAGAVAAADFDHSGRLGLFIGGRLLPGQYPLAPRSALLANRGGRFEDVTDSLAPALRDVGLVTSALWTDVDGDGWPDLLVAVEWGPVKYFHNVHGTGFEDWTEKAGFGAAGTGWWTSIAAADFNGDGRLDYVVGNVGLNTPYRADPAHPALVYYGSFRGDDSSQLVEAAYDGERMVPWRTRHDLGAAIPSVLRRLPRNDAYARASLGEVVGEANLAGARRFAATELRSGVFLSQPDGTYTFSPLPRIAQIAPIQGLYAGDVDGDGHADIVAVQNSFAPIPYVGRFDGGLGQVLRGDGRGNFEPVRPLESGWIVPGDAKGLVALDLDGDGWPGWVVSRNRTPTLAFANRGAPGRHALRVVLEGTLGNPTAVGAQVSLALADGTTELAEVAAGSGYYSQSSPACFFGYPDANPPRRIRVRWPSGNVTESAMASPAATVRLPDPGKSP